MIFVCASSISSSSSSYSVFRGRDSFLIQLPISPFIFLSSSLHLRSCSLIFVCVCHLLGPLHLPLSILHVSSPLSSLLTIYSSVTNLTLLLQSYSLLFLVCVSFLFPLPLPVSTLTISPPLSSLYLLSCYSITYSSRMGLILSPSSVLFLYCSCVSSLLFIFQSAHYTYLLHYLHLLSSY